MKSIMALVLWGVGAVAGMRYEQHYDFIGSIKEGSSERAATVRQAEKPEAMQEGLEIEVTANPPLSAEEIRDIIRDEIGKVLSERAEASSSESSSISYVAPQQSAPVAGMESEAKPEKGRLQEVAGKKQKDELPDYIEYFDNEQGKIVRLSREEFNKRLSRNLDAALHH